MKKISITISGHRTSITLEPEFAGMLSDIAKRQNKSVSELIREIDKSTPSKNLSSAIRVFVLKHKI
ncbi:MAG: ribbon-helix-helix domain-containing protein [Alphaproteobacteria bacterium]|nr:ribbon-helix-helix domain-containing protein [Alphaproteobacteria bacterium]